MVLFEKSRISTLELKNRIIRPATWEGRAGKEGECTPQLIEFIERLAKGGCGLCILGFAPVQLSGRCYPYMCMWDKDESVNSYSVLSDSVHQLGGKIGAQLSHGGAYSRPQLTNKSRIQVPSIPQEARRKELYDELTIDGIREIVSAFAASALRVKQSGFDLVQIQAAHGYLIHQFLSPLTNRRNDEYGGSAEHRSRFLKEIFAAVKDTVGDDFPLSVKVNVSDMVDGGNTFEEAKQLIAGLCDIGLEAIEVSGGLQEENSMGPIRRNINHTDEGYFLPYVKELRSCFDKLSITAVGGIRTYEMAEEIVQSGTADFIALSRPLICEPALPARWAAGEKQRSQCISCNNCFTPGFHGKGVQCTIQAE